MDLDTELDFLLTYLKRSLAKLRDSRLDEIDNDYLSRLKGTKKFIAFEDNLGKFNGKIIYANNSGEITVKTDEGNLKYYRTGQVKISY